MSALRTLRAVVTGAPGSGKGSYCNVLTRNHGLQHISVGELVRGEVKANTPIGREFKQYVDAGHLVPDELILRMTM